MKPFGEFLSNLRNSAELSLEELALLAGSSKSTLSRLENDEVPRPFKGTARKLIITLAEILCTSPKEAERYLALADISRALLTEVEEIQTGVISAASINPQTEVSSLEKLRHFYEQRILEFQVRKVLISRLPATLEIKLQSYERTLHEIMEQLDRLQSRKKLPNKSGTSPAGDSGDPIEDKVLILNFAAHPLTPQQLAKIEELTGTAIGEVITIATDINEAEPLEQQIARLVDAADLSTDDWHKRHILINPPGYAPAAVILSAEIHGRMGHFPSYIRLSPKYGYVTSYEVTEIINLQTIRDKARATDNPPIRSEDRLVKAAATLHHPK